MKVPEALGARLTRLRGAGGRPDEGLTAPVRCDRRTAGLAARLRPGDIAVIDHVDLDRPTAEVLLERGVSAVLNTATAISGRYPNLGPRCLVDAGIPLVDDVDPEVFARVHEGERLTLDGGTLLRGAAVLATGTRQTPESVGAAMAAARDGLPVQLEAFAANAAETLRRDRALFLDGAGVPVVATPVEGRHALVVSRGYHYRADLAGLRSYIRQCRPVLIGAERGADALLEAGYRPDIIVGDFDSVSDRALACGAELVVRTDRDGRAPGLRRIRDLGRDASPFAVTAAADDAAVLLADDAGATVVVTAGAHAGLEEFLDKGRAGMAGVFLTRLRVGGKLVDAQGAARLYRNRISPWSLVALVAAALPAIGLAVFATPAGTVYTSAVATRAGAFAYWFTGLFT